MSRRLLDYSSMDTPPLGARLRLRGGALVYLSGRAAVACEACGAAISEELCLRCGADARYSSAFWDALEAAQTACAACEGRTLTWEGDVRSAEE